MAQPTLTQTQRYCLIFTLALALTLAWTTIAHADGPGDLDITFGGTGIVTTSVSMGIDAGFSVAIQPDNKILVSGIGDGSGSSDSFALVRYNSDGSPDTSFSGTGIVTTPVSGAISNFGFSVAVQPDDKIVVAGTSWSGHTFAVLRYNSTGTLDTDFNGTGIVTTSIGNSFDIGQSMVLQPDGKIVVAGYSENGLGIDGDDIAVVRYTITGSLDTAFNTTGIVTTHITSEFDGGHSVALQPDGNIVVAGFSGNNIAVVRYTTTGALDTSFNSTGIVTTPIGAGASANAVVLQPNGKIVVAGNSDGAFALVRYHNNGTLDTEFNGTGIVTTAITSDTDFGHGLALQPNGKLVVTGFSGQITTDKDGVIAVVRYNNDGSLDTTFSNTGIVTTPLDSGLDSGRSVAIQPDGKIVVAGFSDFGGDKTNFAVLRYLGNHFIYLPIIMKNQ